MNLQTSSSRSSEEHTKIECKNKSITDRNNYILCKECGRFYFGSCNIHTIPVNNKSTNAVASNKSIVSLPDSLEIKKSSIPNAGLGVFAKTKLAIGVNFGPYQGKKVLPHDSVDSHDSRYTWEIIKDGEVAYYIDGKDECHANWMRYINCSRYEAEQNLAAYQYHNQVYHCTYKEVNNGEELLVWYGNCYADHLGINIEQTKELLRTKDEKNLNKITDKNQKRSIDTKQSPFHDTKRIIGNSLERSEEEEKKTPVSKNILPTSNEHKINSKLEDNQPISSLNLSIDEEAIIERYPKRSKRINYREEDNNDSYAYTKRIIENSLECSEEEKKTPVSKNILPTATEQINSKLEDNQPISSLDLSIAEGAIIERYPKRSKRINYREEHNTDSYTYSNNQCKQNSQQPGSQRDSQYNKNSSIKKKKIAESSKQNSNGPNQCTISGSSFQCKNGLTKQTVQTNKDKLFKCTICDYKSSRKYRLKSHMNIHTNNKLFKCTICDHKFTRKDRLKSHMNIHTKEKPFTCLICDRKFTKAGHLKSHTMKHENNYPFKCTLCNYKTVVPANFRRHGRIHSKSKIKPFKCISCDYESVDFCNLKRHEKIHTNEKPYKCKFCDYSSRICTNLKRHTRTVHSEL